MIKFKICKGIGKAKGFKGCGKPVLATTRRHGLCFSCYPEFLTTTYAGKVIMEKAIIRAQKPRKELEQAQADRKNRIGLTTLLKSAVDTCHKYIRLRDKGKPCIACGTEWKEDFQASHFFKAELFSTLKLNENNIHGGCVECNIRKEGNIPEYAVNLPKRIGFLAFEELNELARKDKQIDHKWDREELKRIRTYYREKIKQL